MGVRDRILKSEDLERKTLDVPEWGGEVLIRELTGIERDKLTDLYIDAQVADPAHPGELKQTIPKNYRALICQMCIIDSDGSQIFSEGDIEALQGKSARIIDTVSQAITSLSKMVGIVIEAEIEDFTDDPNGDGGSGSQEL